MTKRKCTRRQWTAIVKSKEGIDKEGIGRAYRNMGNAYYCICQYREEALDCRHRKAWTIAEELRELQQSERLMELWEMCT